MKYLAETLLIAFIICMILLAALIPNISPSKKFDRSIKPIYVMDVQKDICFALYNGGFTIVDCNEEVMKEIKGK